MALFGLSFGKSKQKQRTNEQVSGTSAEQQQNQTTSQQTSTGKQTSTQAQTTEQTSRLLDPQTEAILQNLIAGIAGQGSSIPPEVASAVGGNINFANLLASRAIGGEEAIGANIKPIVEEARRVGTQKLTQQNTALARGAGSSQNTLVAGLQNRGIADLETALAGVEGGLNIQARELASRDLATAFAALSESAKGGADISLAAQASPVENIANLVNVLRGASATTIGKSESTGEVNTQESVTTLVNAIAELIKEAEQSRVGVSSGSGSNSNFGISL